MAEIDELEAAWSALVADLDQRRRDFLMVSLPIGIGWDSVDVAAFAVNEWRKPITRDNFDDFVRAARLAANPQGRDIRFK